MVDRIQDANSKFDQDYFSSEAYAEVLKLRPIWWSKSLLCKFGKEIWTISSVLEIGCGLGHLLEWLLDQVCMQYEELNPWALSAASKNVPEGNFLLLSAENLSVFPDEIFQVVIAKHVVEHLPEPELTVAEFSRVLEPGGLLLATPIPSRLLAQSVKRKVGMDIKIQHI